jgi:hypothetical protein
MKGDEDKFITLRNEGDGSVSFGNDDLARNIGRGIVIIGNKDTKVENVLLMEDMKQNRIRVIQMCDQGHKIVFDSQK